MPGTVFLEGDRLTLHLMEPEDHEFVADHWNAEPVRQQARWPTLPLSGEDIAAVGDRGDGGAQFLVRHDDRSVGFVTLYDLDWRARNAEISYLIRPEEQGNGYATEAVDVCLSYAFDELGLQKVYAVVREGNEGSIQVLDAFGFEREGVLRNELYVNDEFIDEYRFGLLASER